MKITVVDDYAQRVAARKAAKSADAIRRRDKALAAKSELEAEKDELLWRPSKENNYPPSDDEMFLINTFGVSGKMASGPRRFLADRGRA